MTPVKPHINYESLQQEAFRGVVRAALMQVAETGLPGDHHFYIAFDTRAAGVVLSKRLLERYQEEMIIVLQHRFWDLEVSPDQFEVKLTFDSIPERLVIPFKAVKAFYDPSVPYGLQFGDADRGDTAGRPRSGPMDVSDGEDGMTTVGRGPGRTGPDRRRPGRRPRGERLVGDPPSGEGSAEAPAPGAGDASSRPGPAETRTTPKPVDPAAPTVKPQRGIPAAGKTAALPSTAPATGSRSADKGDPAAPPAAPSGEPEPIPANPGGKVVRLDTFRKK